MCLDVLRSQTVDTCFVVVVDITKVGEFVNELASLRELSEDLAGPIPYSAMVVWCSHT